MDITEVATLYQPTRHNSIMECDVAFLQFVMPAVKLTKKFIYGHVFFPSKILKGKVIIKTFSIDVL